MNFIELNAKEYSEFIKTNPLNNFLQSPKMDLVANQKGQNVYYVGIKKDKKILCGARLIAINNRFNKKIFYSPRGLIIDYNDKKLLEKFTQELKKYIKKKNGYILHIDPNILYKQRDINGNLVEHGFDNSNVIKTLKSLGYKHLGFTKGFDTSKQVRWQFAIDLKGKSEEEIFRNMKPNTRNLISKAQKLGIEVKEMQYEELEEFKKITSETSQRRNFCDKSLEYYQTMYKEFVKEKEAKFLIATLDIEKTIEKHIKEKEKTVDLLAKLKKCGIESKSSKTKEKILTDKIQTYNKRITELIKIKKTDGKKINLSAAMFMTYGKEVIYSFSGNIAKYMNFNAQYLIQWEMIKYAIKNNFSKYNFYGITGIFDKNDPDYGVYEFKKGFNGQVEEYIGDFELPISSYYSVNKFIKKIKKVYQ